MTGGRATKQQRKQAICYTCHEASEIIKWIEWRRCRLQVHVATSNIERLKVENINGGKAIV